MKIICVITYLTLCAISCTEPELDTIPPIKKQNKIEISNSVTVQKREIKYQLLPMNKKTITWLQSIGSIDSLNVLYALNRVNNTYLFRQDSIVIPDTFAVDLNTYSPFPIKVRSLSKIDKLILFSYPIQAFSAYQNGTLIRWGPLSMGSRKKPTPTGLLFTNWKSKKTISTINDEWIMNWYFNLDNFEGVSMHEYDLPGFPASHSCVRMLAQDASWMYDWAEQWILSSYTQTAAKGTPVIIYGSYNFGNRKPWRKIVENNNALIINEDNLNTQLLPFLPKIMTEQAKRHTYITNKKAKE